MRRKIPGEVQPAAEIVVEASWAEDQFAKGRLELTSDQIDALEQGVARIKLPAELVNPLLSLGSRESPIEWIEPKEAVHLLSSRIGGDIAAKVAIAERLKDGAIECTHVWISEGPDIGQIEAKRPKFPTKQQGDISGPWVSAVQRSKGPVMLGGAFWRYSDDWDADLKRWNWHEGLFVASRNGPMVASVDGVPAQQTNSHSRSRMIVAGIRFSREDVENISPAMKDSSDVQIQSGFGLRDESVAKPGNSNAGSKPHDKWAEWVAELVMMEHEGEILVSITPEKLLSRVADKLAKRGIEGPTRSRTYPVAKAVVDVLRQRGNLVSD